MKIFLIGYRYFINKVENNASVTVVGQQTIADAKESASKEINQTNVDLLYEFTWYKELTLLKHPLFFISYYLYRRSVRRIANKNYTPVI